MTDEEENEFEDSAPQQYTRVGFTPSIKDGAMVLSGFDPAKDEFPRTFQSLIFGFDLSSYRLHEMAVSQLSMRVH